MAEGVMFITGGSRGIGAGIALRAAEKGYDVAFTYQSNLPAAEAVLAEAKVRAPASRVRAYALDVRDSAAVDAIGDRVEEELGEVTVLVCNAGVTYASLAVSLSDEDWANVLQTNLTGAFYTSRRFLSGMMTQRFGRIVFISSIAARGMKGDPAYCASKAGMLGLSGALSKEYGGRGITSNALILGFFNTDMTRDGAAVGKRELFVKHCPAGRTGEVDEVAAAVLYFASREAAFVNGQEIGLTGGLDHTP